MESSDGRLGPAEMYYTSSAAASSRATLYASPNSVVPARGVLGRHHWTTCRGRRPRAQDVLRRLRHVFDTPRRVRTRRDGARAPVPEPAEKRLPRDSRARVAMHALCFGNGGRGGGVMAASCARFRFAHRGRAALISRGCRGGLCRVRRPRRWVRIRNFVSFDDQSDSRRDPARPTPSSTRPSARPSARTATRAAVWKRRTFARVDSPAIAAHQRVHSTTKSRVGSHASASEVSNEGPSRWAVSADGERMERPPTPICKARTIGTIERDAAGG